MARDSETPERVRKILGGRGRKLHTHEIHVRRTHNGGYIARHELRDHRGQPPDDGQRGEREYAIPNKEALMAHMDEHMGPPPPPDGADEENEGPMAAQEPGEPA